MQAAAVAAALGVLIVFSQGWVNLVTGGDDAASTDAGIFRVIFLPAYAIGVVGLAMNLSDTVKAGIRQPFLILLVAVAAASYVWSIAPDHTARRVFAMACTTLCGVVLGARYRWSQLAELLAASFVILGVVSLASAVVMPSLGRMTEIFPGAWRGLWPEKNALGGNMALGFVICGGAAMLNPRRFWIWAGGGALCLFLVLMSTSKTSLVSLMLGAAGLGFVWLVRRGPAMGVTATWLAVAGIALLGGFILVATDVFFEILGKDATLTGRTRIWEGVMHQIRLRPWQGYGYFAVWDDQSGWGPIAWITHDAGFRAQYAHNSWLEQWLGMGILGLVCWGLFWLQTMTTALIAVYRNAGAYLAFPFLIVYSLVSLTESIAVTYNDLRWVIFVMLAVKLAWPDKPDAYATSRAPSATVTTLNPRARAASARRASAPGVQPH
jgi:O-antigen ligase